MKKKLEHDFLDLNYDASERLSDLVKFLEHMELYLEEDKKWFREEGHVDLDIEYKPLLENTIPSILYSSVTLAIIIQLEVYLRQFCRNLETRFSLKLSLNDLSGSTIEKFRRYSENVSELKIPFKRVSWEDVLGMFEIRNCLIHQDGDMNNFPKQTVVRSFFQRHNIEFPNDFKLKMDKRVCELVLELATAFVEDIYEAVRVREGQSCIQKSS